jgi:solute carrier family 12 sodium/potassium/chloride transporter 2
MVILYCISLKKRNVIILTFSVRLSAQLDMIALLISDLFLITFAFLNYACFHVDLVQPVGWRPTFKVDF